jgi:cysteine-rich repeat protein
LVRAPGWVAIGNNTTPEIPGVVTYDGTQTIVIDWDDVLGADDYYLIMEEAIRDGTSSRGIKVATFTTHESKVTIPPQLLEPGHRYVFAAGASRGNDEVGLRRFRIPAASASSPSGIMLFSASCGNGTVETSLGEECDTMGASATCDPDCTLAVCGDSYHNTFTTEECDQGGAFTRSCDSNCTLPVCGDGASNGNAEDCDDGNVIDNGNGCSATCTRLGTCGDGVVQSFFETCEPPNTTTCRGDCRPF